MPAYMTNTKCPVEGHLVLPNKQVGLGKSGKNGVSMKTAQPIRLCLFEQYDFGTNDYYISMTFQKTSIDIVYKRKKRLAKSGKDKRLVSTG